MTTETKKKPAFYIFAQGENGENVRVGAAFAHQKGKGLNIVLDGKRYVAFPPKAQQPETEEVGA